MFSVIINLILLHGKINISISYSDIRNTVLSMKSNKTPNPDGIPIEFYKALFKSKNWKKDSLMRVNSLKLFSIWEGSFSNIWNLTSIVSIPEKGVVIISLSHILFNLFINDILNNYYKYSVNIGNKKMLWWSFSDDLVLIIPNEAKMKAPLCHVFNWTNKNEISFGINKEKCATMVTKALNFANYVLSLDVFYC